METNRLVYLDSVAAGVTQVTGHNVSHSRLQDESTMSFLPEVNMADLLDCHQGEEKSIWKSVVLYNVFPLIMRADH